MKNILFINLLFNLVFFAQPANAQRTSCEYTISSTWTGTCTVSYGNDGTHYYRTSNGHTIRLRGITANYECPVLYGIHYYPASIDGSRGCVTGKGIGYLRAYKLNGTFSFTIYY